MQYTVDTDGRLVRFERADGLAAIKVLRAAGFKYGNGECGRGLYSPTWDRQMGYWWGEQFLLNPSLLRHLPDAQAAGEAV